MNYTQKLIQALRVNKWPVISLKEQQEAKRLQLLAKLTGKK